MQTRLSHYKGIEKLRCQLQLRDVFLSGSREKLVVVADMPDACFFAQGRLDSNFIGLRSLASQLLPPALLDDLTSVHPSAAADKCVLSGSCYCQRLVLGC